VALVTFATFTDIVAYSVAVPVLPDLSRKLGASPTIIGLLFAAFGVTLLTVSIPMGHVSDRIGRKAPMVGGLVGLAAATLLFASSAGCRGCSPRASCRAPQPSPGRRLQLIADRRARGARTGRWIVMSGMSPRHGRADDRRWMTSAIRAVPPGRRARRAAALASCADIRPITSRPSRCRSAWCCGSSRRHLRGGRGGDLGDPVDARTGGYRCS
jgi:MFS family permease